MAERNHAAEAEHEVEAGGGQREDQDAAGEADVELLAPGACSRAAGQRQQQADVTSGFW
jgi:hypothetical protein